MEIMSNKIQDPLKDYNTLLKVFESYSRSTNGRKFYFELLNYKNSSNINNENDFNRFYVFMFKNWRDRILHYGKVKFVDIFPHNNYPRVIEYLNFLPEPQTKEDVDKIMSGKYIKDKDDPYKSKDIFDLDISRWDHGSNGKWYSCSSGDVFDYKNTYMKKKHILFVNINKEQIYNFATNFVNMCDEEKLPFDFKLLLAGQRDDRLQIYCDSEHLNQYINIIEELKNKYPSSFSSDVPLLTGKISDGLSYGTYTESDVMYQDYFIKRCNLISLAINKTIVDYIKKNKNRKVDYFGSSVPLYEFLALKAKDKYIDKLKKEYIRISNTESDEKAIQELGHSYDEISSIPFYANVYSKMLLKLENNLDIIGKSNGEFNEYDINSSIYLCDVLKELSILIFNNDKEYRETFMNYLNFLSSNNNIDRFNFSIDTSALELDNMLYKSKDELGFYR